MKTINTILVSLLVALVLLVGGLAYQIGSDKPAQVVNQTITVKEVVFDNATSAKVDVLTAKFNNLTEVKDKSDKTLQNDTARKLVLSEISEKSFKIELMNKLNNNSVANHSVEEYKDILNITSEIKDVDLDDDEATVSVVLKVTFKDFDDSDYKYLATVNVEFIVADLVVDDGFEDSEVDSYKFNVKRFKELD